MEYSNELKRIAQAYNLTENAVIYCYALAAGAPQADSYKIIMTTKKNMTEENAEQMAADYLRKYPGAKILINRIKAGKRKIVDERTKDIITKCEDEEKEELRTRAGIISKLIDNVTACQGKDAVSGLQTLAKLQGLDKPEETQEEDKRTFVLTYLSHCRTCRLMAAYIQTQKAIKSE